MLTRVKLAGFKAIYNSGSVNLGPLRLFIGRNGSGKSSFVEALQWLQESLASNVETATATRFGDFDNLCNHRTKRIFIGLAHGTASHEVRYEAAFVHGSMTNHEPRVETEWCSEGRARGTKTTIATRVAKRRDPVRTIGDSRQRVSNPLLLALASATRKDTPGASRLLHFLERAVFLRLSPKAISRAAPATFRTGGPALDESGRRLTSLLHALSPRQLRSIAKELALVVPEVKALKLTTLDEFSSFELVERTTSRGGSKRHSIPSKLLSEGIRRLTAIFALLCVEPRPPLIVIEEIENGLDPWTLRLVFRRLREASTQGVQVLLTTHSPFLLDHVEPEEVIHVSRESGETTYIPITSYSLVSEDRGVVAPGAMYLGDYLKRRRPSGAS